MANIAVNSQYMLLNWLLGGTLPTRPTTWAIGLSLGAPSSVSGSGDFGAASGYTRQTAATMFNTVVSGSNTMTNLSALTFGPFSSTQSIFGHPGLGHPARATTRAICCGMALWWRRAPCRSVTRSCWHPGSSRSRSPKRRFADARRLRWRPTGGRFKALGIA